MLSISEQEERKTGKELYSYQKGAIQKIFQCFETAAEDYQLEEVKPLFFLKL